MGIHEVYGAVYRQLGFDAVENPISCQHPVWRASPTASEAASGDLRRISGAAGEGVGSTRSWRLRTGDATRAARASDRIVFARRSTLNRSLRTSSSRTVSARTANPVSRRCCLPVTTDGLPVSYEVFPGATGHSLVPTLAEMRQRQRPSRVRRRPRHVQRRQGDGSAGLHCRRQDPAQGAHEENPRHLQAADRRGPFRGNIAVVVWSWSLVRARKDAHDRQKAIAKLVKKLERSDRELLSSHGNKRAVEGAARLTRRQNPRGRTVGRGHQHS